MAYKWEYPYEWLKHKAGDWDEGKLRDALTGLAAKLDSDTLQDYFQSDMDADGYFTPLPKFEVVVNNIGVVYSGVDEDVALATFNSYVADSKHNIGKVSNESVYLMKGGEIEQEHQGSTDVE